MDLLSIICFMRFLVSMFRFRFFYVMAERVSRIFLIFLDIPASTRVSHLRDGDVKTFDMTPEDHGLRRAMPQDIRGGTAGENARIIRRVLDGEKGPERDVVILNTAAAFMAAGLDNTFREGIERAAESIDSGKAREKLEQLVEHTRECGSFDRSRP